MERHTTRPPTRDPRRVLAPRPGAARAARPRAGTRRGTSLTEIVVGMCLMSFGLIPVTRSWVCLTRQTGQYTTRSESHIGLSTALDAYRSVPVRELIRMADESGRLPGLDRMRRTRIAMPGTPRVVRENQERFAGTDGVEAHLSPGRSGYRLEVRMSDNPTHRLQVLLPRVHAVEVPAWS